MLCNSDWDSQSGFCADDSLRKGEIAEAQAQQAAGVMKGLASAFGLGAALQNATDAKGAKFCPECGTKIP